MFVVIMLKIEWNYDIFVLVNLIIAHIGVQCKGM